MSGNVGSLERLVRMVTGIGMITSGMVMQGNLGCLLIWLGFVPLLTGWMGSCPVYCWLGINSCKMKSG